jgi:hypothetical protein
MAYRRMLWLPDVLRDAGLDVVTHDGWERRGLSTSSPFEPEYVVWHHDASAAGDSPGVPDYMIRNFDTGAAQTWVNRYGVWHVIASGRAPHAGRVLPGKPDNYTSLGVETDHTVNEPWPPELLLSLRVGTKAILDRMGHGTDHLEFHKTICSPPGRKIDPAGLDLATERRNVAVADAPAPKPIPEKKDWFDMATEKDLRDIVRSELNRIFQPYGREGAEGPDISEARVASPDGKRIYNLGSLLFGARDTSIKALAAVEAMAKEMGPTIEAAVADALKDAVVEVDVNVNQSDVP